VVCLDEDGYRIDDEGNAYIITEYLGGDYVPLDQFIAQHRDELRQNPALAMRIACNLIRGLLDIHSSNVAHRDIKPGNILINARTLLAKFIDFGLSCWNGQCRYSPLGTPLYMSPETWFMELILGGIEVANNVRTLQAADIWAMGALIVELFNGGRSLWDILEHQVPELKQVNDADKLEAVPRWLSSHIIPVRSVMPRAAAQQWPWLVPALAVMLSRDFSKRRIPQPFISYCTRTFRQPQPTRQSR
jgi:serine/threonine protein kinase